MFEIKRNTKWTPALTKNDKNASIYIENNTNSKRCTSLVAKDCILLIPIDKVKTAECLNYLIRYEIENQFSNMGVH